MSFNKVLLIGNVGKEPEIRHLESGVAVASFTLATTERYKDRNGVMQDQTEWHNVVCWRNLAELSEKYINKGSQIFVEGKIRTRSWQDQTGQKRYTTEIVADNIRLLGKRTDSQQQGYQPQLQAPQASGYTQMPGNGAPAYQQQAPVQQATMQNFSLEEASDDLPF